MAMNILNTASLAILASSFTIAAATAAETDQFGCVASSGNSLCLPGKRLGLNYQPKSRVLSLSMNGRPVKIARVDKGYGPELIGMEGYNRFLPLALQPYLSRNVVLFNSVIRSTGGEGQGQCGSGYELYLNAVNVAQSPPRLVSKTQIGSCYGSMFPDDMENGPKDFSAYSVKDGALAIKFLSYPGFDDSPVAVLSRNLRKLEFMQAREP